MKAIFLDMDGVLCTIRSHIGQGHSGMMRALDREAIGLLNRVTCHETRYVLSSTWRVIHRRPWMENHLRQFGWTGRFTGDWRTKDLPSRVRGDEISEWLSRHPEVETYAIIDDDSDFLPEQMPFHVHTSSMDGLSWQNFQDLSRILHGDPDAWLRPDFKRFDAKKLRGVQA